jgi:hypothetical protein
VVRALLPPATAQTTILQKAIGKDAVDPKIARAIASRNHRGQRNRFDDAVIEHVERVAAAVPPEARAVAWLHDLLELTAVGWAQLRGRGLTPVEESALALLTRAADEPYDAYVLRIADAPGRAGSIARMVKLADLDDHLAHGRIPRGAPPYAWARRCVLERTNVTPSTAVA